MAFTPPVIGQQRMIHRRTPGSSCFERVGYNFLTRELFLLFRDRSQYPEYVYGGVPPDVVIAFFEAPSMGKFFHAYINGNSFYTISTPSGAFRLGALVRRVTSIPRNIARDVQRAWRRRKNK